MKNSNYTTTKKKYQFLKLKYNVSLATSTLFSSMNLSLVKCLWALYMTASDNEGIATFRLPKWIGVFYQTARNILKKIRTAMEKKGGTYWLENIIEMDDLVMGGKLVGEKGRSALRKNPIVAAGVEKRGNKPGLMAAQVVDMMDKLVVGEFIKYRLQKGRIVRNSVFPVLNFIGEAHKHDNKIAFLKQASPCLHIVHILLEFCYGFNRPFWSLNYRYIC